jgi:hypothetical protein
MKLTKPQEALLRELEQEPRYVGESYSPGKALLELGFAEDVGWSHLEITDAGRKWIKERDAK